MDGCTFGVGIANADGGVRVGHSNAQTQADENLPDPLAPQRQAQRDNLTTGGTAVRIVDPDRYRQTVVRGRDRKGRDIEMGCKAITIGLRINNTWEFYYQHQVHDGGSQWREGIELVKLQ
jgi:hypothetical protein